MAPVRARRRHRHPRHRRCRSAVPPHHEPDGRDRRRPRRGPARRRCAGRPRVLPVPPDRARRTRNFLVSEAVRGEGAVLVDEPRRPVHDRRAPGCRLAPRDVVARGIAAEMAAQGGLPVGLDATALGADYLASASPHRHSAPPRYRLGTRTRCPSPPPRTTGWAASPPTSTGAPPSRASTPSGRSPAQACMAQIGSHPTRCSRARSSVRVPPTRSRAGQTTPQASRVRVCGVRHPPYRQLTTSEPCANRRPAPAFSRADSRA